MDAGWTDFTDYDEEVEEIEGEVVPDRHCTCCIGQCQYCAECYASEACVFGHCLAFGMFVVAQMVINAAFCMLVLLVNVASRHPLDEEYAESQFRTDNEWILLIALTCAWFLDMIFWVVAVHRHWRGLSSYTLAVLVVSFLGLTAAVIGIGLTARNATREPDLNLLLRRMAARCLQPNSARDSDCDFIRSAFGAARVLLPAIIAGFMVEVLMVGPAFAVVLICHLARGGRPIFL